MVRLARSTWCSRQRAFECQCRKWWKAPRKLAIWPFSRRFDRPQLPSRWRVIPSFSGRRFPSRISSEDVRVGGDSGVGFRSFGFNLRGDAQAPLRSARLGFPPCPPRPCSHRNPRLRSAVLSASRPRDDRIDRVVAIGSRMSEDQRFLLASSPDCIGRAGFAVAVAPFSRSA